MAGTPNSKRKKFTKFTDETINKLESVFSMDGTIEEACFYADIRTQTYYNWIKENPKLKERFDELRNKPILKARTRVMKGIDESYSNAMDYLKRKKKGEFGDNVDINHKMNMTFDNSFNTKEDESFKTTHKTKGDN